MIRTALLLVALIALANPVAARPPQNHNKAKPVEVVNDVLAVDVLNGPEVQDVHVVNQPEVQDVNVVNAPPSVCEAAPPIWGVVGVTTAVSDGAMGAFRVAATLQR